MTKSIAKKSTTGSLPPAVPLLAITPTFSPWTHTSDDSYIYQLSLVLATATVSLYLYIFFYLEVGALYLLLFFFIFFFFATHHPHVGVYLFVFYMGRRQRIGKWWRRAVGVQRSQVNGLGELLPLFCVVILVFSFFFF